MSGFRKYTVFYNFSSLGIIQVASFLLSLIVIPHVIRIVGAAGFGVIAVAQVLMFYLSVAADNGFNRTAIRDVALYKDDRQRISRIFFTVMAAKLLITFFLFLVLLVLILVVPLFRLHMDVYLLGFSFVLGQTLLVNWFFQGFEKMHYMALVSLLSRLLFVGLVLLFMRTTDDLALYIFFMGLGNIVMGLISIAIVIRKYRLEFAGPGKRDILYELKKGWPVTVTNLSQTSIQYIGIFILRLFSTDLTVGYYSIAERIYFAVKMMLDVFSQVAYPRVCVLLKQGLPAVIAFFRQAYVPFFGAVLTGCILVFILAPQIINFFMGNPYAHSVFLLRVLSVAAVIVCLGIPASLILLAGDHRKAYLRVFAGGTLVNIATNFAFAPIWYATGTVTAVIITELLITVALYWQVRRLKATGQFTAMPDGRE